MNILEFLLSKKILVVLSGLVFAGVAFASSGAASMLQNNVTASEAKVPEVQEIEDVQQNTPAPAPAITTTTRVPVPTQSPTPSVRPATVVTPSPTPKPSASPTTITGLRQSGSDDREETEDSETENTDSSGSAINNAFQRVRSDD